MDNNEAVERERGRTGRGDSIIPRAAQLCRHRQRTAGRECTLDPRWTEPSHAVKGSSADAMAHCSLPGLILRVVDAFNDMPRGERIRDILQNTEYFRVANSCPCSLHQTILKSLSRQLLHTEYQLN